MDAKTALCVSDFKQAATSRIGLAVLVLVMLSMILPAAAQIPDHIPADDALEAFYPLNNGIWTDLSGNGWNAGTNTPAVDRHGAIGGCADFTDPSAGQDVTINGFDIGADEFTISFWYRNLNPTQQNQTPFNTSPHAGIAVNYNYQVAQKLALFFGNGSTWNHVAAGASTNTFVDTDWHHLVIRKTGLLVEMIVDDQIEFTTTLGSATPSNIPTQFHFGSDTYSYSEVFNGYLDELGMWSRALTDAEISTLYSGIVPQLPALFPTNPDLGPGVTGLQLRPMSSSDGPSDFAFDVFDLARDKHHVALRLNGTGMSGGELVRTDGSDPIITVIQSGLDIPHSATSDTVTLPVTGAQIQVETGSTTGSALSFLIINGQPPLPESMVDLLTPTEGGLPEWTEITTFQDDPTQWQEWAAVVEDPILVADMYGDAATYTATAFASDGTAMTDTLIAGYHFGDLDLASADFNALDGLVRQDVGGNDCQDPVAGYLGDFSYDVVAIGDQCWFAENVRTASRNDGGAIVSPYHTIAGPFWDANSAPRRNDWNWQGCNPAYSYSGVCPAPNHELEAIFGRLYNSFAVQGHTTAEAGPLGWGGVCPVGWRLPSVAQFQTLWDFAEAAYPGQSAQALMSAEGFNHSLAVHQGFDAFGFNGTAHGVIISNTSFTGYNIGLYGGYWTGGLEPWQGGWVPDPYGGGDSYTTTFFLGAGGTQPSLSPTGSYFGNAVRCIRETPVLQTLGYPFVDLPEIRPLEGSVDSMGLWAEHADVQSFQSHHLATRYEAGGTFAEGELHVSFPITAPLYDGETFEDVPYTGADAVAASLPYWGFPNGVEGYAELFVEVTSVDNPSVKYAVTVNSEDHPLMNKDCPFLIQDSLRTSIPMDVLTAAGFQPGQPVDVSAMAFWATPARRTALFSQNHIQNRQVLCTEIDPLVQANLVPDTARVGTVTELTLTFNDQFPSSGGYLRIQRRDAADADDPDGGWSYLVEQTDGTYQATTDRSQATSWRNLDADVDGTVDPFTIQDALPDYPWKCKQVQYRVEQDMCGTYYAGPPVGVHIMGDINTPWTVDGVLQEEIEVSKGDYPFKVKLQWGNATDQEELVDQFRIYRRLYTTHVDTGVGWTQIFSTEDLLTYEDEDLAAGLLYEYKVGALMTCGDGNGNEVSVEFFPPYPNDIGFRSSFGAVSGTILYEDGVTPSGDVRVELQPQGQNDARKSIQLGDDHYIAFNLGGLTENSSLTWPDIHTTQNGEVMTLSQWIKWESTDVGPNPDPLMAANMTNAEGNVIEAFALWGDTADAAPGHYRLNLRQENIRRDFTDIEFKFDEWHHVLLTLEEGTANGIGYSLTLSAHPDQVEKVTRTEQTLEFLQMTPENYEELRAGWHSFTWNGAVAPDTACTDPFSANFNPLLINGSAQFCMEAYAAEDAGCADPLIAAAPAGYDLPLGIGGACDYSGVATGDLISVRWFSDASATPDEFPVIYRMDGGSEVEVARFDSELAVLHTDGLDSTGASTYAYSMPVLTTQLVPGDYRIRVLDKSTGSETDANDFSGNFSVRNDRGQEYVNCIQYLPSEVVNGEYDFSVLSAGCAVNTADQAVTVLTDCAECYSIGIAPGSTYELALGTGGADHLATTGFSLAFWFKAAEGTADLLTLTDRNDPSKSLVLSSIPEAYPDAGPLRLGYTGTRLAMTGTGSTPGALARYDSLPSNVYNVFGLQPGQWYQAVLEMTAATGGILTVRSTDLNNGDAEPWNNTRTFDFTAEGQYSAPIDHIDPASIRFGSATSTAQVTVHGASLWTSSLLPAQQTALFEGISTDGLYADGALQNQQGLWQGTSNLPLDALAAVLVPNNTGQFVDHMAGKHLRGLGGLNGTAVLSEPLFAYSALTTAADSAGVIAGLTAIGSASGGQFSVRTAPWGTCIPGCSRLETACNFNPFASLYTPCDISCTGEQFIVEQLSTGHWHLDEIRGFRAASPLAYGEDRLDPYTTREAADFWMHQYPDPLTEGLFWMLDLDENVGNALYDRSKYGQDQDSWTKNHAHILHQQIDEAGVTTVNAAWDGHNHYRNATPLSLKNFDNTAQTDGKYSIGNVKYVGASTIFDVIPAKSSGGFAHDFMPPQSLALVGDLVLNSTDIDFTDVSAFEVDLNVHYQDIQTGHPDYSGTGDPMASDCPVKGVRFKVDGTLLRDDQQEPFETDELGRLTISVSRGEHTIEPIFTHLDEEGTDDDHTFNSTPTSGKVVYVTGPSPRNFDGSVDPQFQFIDVTTRRIVGRVIGGEVQAAKEWDASQNNLGIASFQLVKENPVENSESFSLAHTCPAVQVTTDIKGQYDVLVTPGHYRMATPHDAAGFPAIFSKNDYSDLDVMGWEGEPVDSWVHAFRDATKDDGEGNYNINDPAYAQWKTVAKTEWNQELQYPGKSISGDALPEDAYHRIDLVHRPDPTIRVLQTSADDSGVCSRNRHEHIYEPLEDVFLGETHLTIDNENGLFASPLAESLVSYQQYRTSQEDELDSEASFDGAIPFLMGLPVIKSNMLYCMNVKPVQEYKTQFLKSDSTHYDFASSDILWGNNYQLAILNGLGSSIDMDAQPSDVGQEFLQVELTAEDSSGFTYGFYGIEPTFNLNDQIPRAQLSIQLMLGDIPKAQWRPFEKIIKPDDDLTTVPSLLKTPAGEIIYQHSLFTAIILGSFEEVAGVPVSRDPYLEWILRDPPGDGSSCTLVSGSKLSYSKGMSMSFTEKRARAKNTHFKLKKQVADGNQVAPLGVGLQFSTEINTETGKDIKHKEEYSENSAGGVDIKETFEFDETISTSDLEQNMDYGINQDLFYGKVTNTSMGVMRSFELLTVDESIQALSGPIRASALGLDMSNKSYVQIRDLDSNGVADVVPFIRITEAGEWDAENGLLEFIDFMPAWVDRVSLSQLPASDFLKTQYTIESVDIPLLELARNDYFQSHPDLYAWPDGTPSNVPYSQLGWSYPPGMMLANNDDHRWDLFHQKWMQDTMIVTNGIDDFPDKASTILRGYNAPDNALSAFDFLNSANYPSDILNRLLLDQVTGDDRVGPGYQYNGASQLDSVRFFNNQIAAWFKILAENELEKIQERKKLFDNLDQFSDPDNLSNWGENLESSSADFNSFSLDDFSSITTEDGDTLLMTPLNSDASLWSEANFEPFFLSFSGGGASYTQSVSKSNFEEVTRTTILSSESSGIVDSKSTINGLGYSSNQEHFKTVTETRKNSSSNETSMGYSFTLSDDDEQDFFLVAVIPGRGMNGPIFLNLGGAASCPWTHEEPSKFHEWYPALIPGDYNPVANNGVLNCESLDNYTITREFDPEEWQVVPLESTSSDSESDNDNSWGGIPSGPFDDTLSTNVMGLPSSAVSTLLVPAILAVQTGIAIYAAVKGNIDGAATAAVVTAKAAIMTIADQVLHEVWRDQVIDDFQFDTDTAWSGFDATLVPEDPGLALDQELCDLILEPTSPGKLEQLQVQPEPIRMEVPKITLSYTAPDGTVYTGMDTINPPITSFMDEPIGLTMEVRNDTPYPFGGPTNYVFYNDIFYNTLGAQVFIGGQTSTTVEYQVNPSWSAGPTYAPVTIHHSGVESPEFMSGSVDVIMLSVCDWNIQDEARVYVNFEPACSDVALTAPLENWSANLDLVASGAYFSTEGKVPLAVDIARNDYTNWQHPDDGDPVIVQYRPTGTTQWTTITGTNAANTAVADEDGRVQDFNFTWNPLDAPDICNGFAGQCQGYEGGIELRAITQCASEFAVDEISDVIAGTVDFVRPELYGNPMPADGFYRPGDELTLRWSEAMETFSPTASLNPDSVRMMTTMNANYIENSGGLQFTAGEYLGIPQGPALDAAGWSMSWKLWAGGESVPTGLPSGVVFTQGDQALASLSAELVDAGHLAVVHRANGAVVDADTLVIPLQAGTNWNPFWNTFELIFEPAADAGAVDISLDLNGTGLPALGSLSFAGLSSKRVTWGNGWSNGEATGTPLPLPLQDIRMWSSQRETQLSMTPNLQLTGKELGLQVWLPLDELSGVPVEEARGRDVQMEANWFNTTGAQALDFAGNTGDMVPSLAGINFTPVGSRSTTLEFWMKPGGPNEAILGVNGSADPSLDTEWNSWSFETDAAGHLIVANGNDTLRTPSTLTDRWHHIALVRHHNGAVNLYLDGDGIDSDAAYSHGSMIPLNLFVGARKFNAGPTSYDMPFTGKFDELRVWSTAVPVQTIRERERDGVYGYDNLVVHAPFEARSAGDDAVEADQAYTYTAWDGYFYYNDPSSLAMPQSFLAKDWLNAMGSTEVSSIVQSADAPLMQAEPQSTLGASGDVASVSWNSLHDECILELNEDALYKYEDQLVTFTLPKSGLRDAAGNTTASDLTFEMRIDRNPLKWGDAFLTWEGQPEDGLMITTTIANVGNETRYFEIAGLPSWIEVSPLSGTLPADSEIEITFTAEGPLDVGTFLVDALLKGGIPCGTNATGGFCYGERTTMEIDVYLEAPEFTVEAMNFTNVMPVVARAYKNSIASDNPRDIVLAYIGDELRGFSPLDLSVADQQLAFVSVFYNDDEAAEAIEFRIWDARTGAIRAEVDAHWPDLSGEPLTVHPNEDGYSSLFQPLLLNASEKVESVTQLLPGWNWVSFNVSEDDGSMMEVEKAFASLPEADLLNVKGHGVGSFRTAGVWTPTGLPAAASSSVDLGMRYQVEMKSDADTTWTLRNIGPAAHPLDHPQDLVVGWNELGYLPQVPLSVEDAMQGLADADTVLQFDDLVKSRYEGFALYAGDGEWIGSLGTMRPGNGYRMRLGDLTSVDAASAAPAGTLEWPVVGAFYDAGWRTDNSFDGTAAPDAAWPEQDVRGLEGTMNMVVRLELPPSQPQGLGDALGAFVEDGQGFVRCVGQAIPLDSDAGLLYFLTVYGEVGTSDLLHFRWKSGLTDLEYVADEGTTFEATRLRGDLQAPFLLRFSEAGLSTPDLDGDLIAYPNPFRDELTIHWHGTLPVQSLRIEDANGRLVEVLDCDQMLNGPCRWVAGGIENGVYFVRAMTAQGQRTVRVIK